MSVRSFLIVALVMFGASCGEKTKQIVAPPPPLPPPLLTIASGATATDTIDALIGTPLVIRIARGDTPVRGVRVTFTTRITDTTRTGLRVAARPFETYDASADDTTGADGTVSVRARFGTQVGSAYVVVAAPSLSLLDSARFTVNAGHGVKIASIGPFDTAAFANSTLRLRISVTDRARNPTRDWHFQTFGGVTAVDGDSVVRTGPDCIRTNIVVVATYGGPSDNILLSIVPRDTMMIERYTGLSSNFRVTYQTMAVDGSNVRVIDSTATFQFTNPRWLPDGRVIFADTTGLIAVTTSGVHTRIVPMSWSAGGIYAAVASPAGDWIYYGAAAFAGSVNGRESLWRVHVDGTGAEPLASNIYANQIDVLPDGRSLIVSRDFGASIERFDIQTRAFTKLGVKGIRTRLSPAGDRIAFVAQDFTALRVMNVDGTGVRDIARLPFVDAQLNWSSDGQFVLAATQTETQGPYIPDRYQFFRVSNGDRLPLAFTINGINGYGEMAIKPR